VVTAVILAGCSGIDISRDYDPHADFAKLKTWAWIPPKPMNEEDVPRVTGLSRERIQSAIESELSARDYQKVEPGTADFLVRYAAGVGRRLQEGSYSSGGDFYAYDEGRLIIDILSGKDKRLMWRGMARTKVKFEMTPEERDERIKEAVHDIFEGFPPKTTATPEAEAK
jgi:hypothetical protein